MKYIDYVNVKMGTRSTGSRSCGNVNPLTAIPFGMNHFFIQTRNDYRWGFSPDDVRTGGIRLTHVPSPWIGDYSKIVMFASSGDGHAARTDGKQESSYNVKTAVMTPAYISMHLNRYGVDMQLSPTVRGGILRATWDKNIPSFIPGGELHRFLFDFGEGNSPYEIDYENGFVRGSTDNFRSWRAEHLPTNFKMYFCFKFDSPLDQDKTIVDKNRVSLAFKGSPDSVNCRFATSFISAEQAEFNYKSEVEHRSLDEIRAEAEEHWEKLLGKIEIQADESTMRTFYSCFYRTFLFPRIFHEVCPDGAVRHYSPADGKLHDGVMYTDNGFWDTYKTVYPMYSIIYRERYEDICRALVNYYKEGGWLPRWMSPSALNCMPGTAVDAVFGDAAEKKVVTEPELLADMLEALLKHVDNPPESPALGRDGWDDFNNLGYVSNKYHESVNKTQDYSYGNFCVSQVAKALGRQSVRRRLLKTARNYKNLFDPETGFLRAKDANGNMRSDFTEFDWGGDYTEGGPWQNSFAVYHDFNGYSQLLGGRNIFLDKVKQLFDTPPYFREFGYGSEIHEMTEMVLENGFGQCALSNQPSFHVPYLFSCLGDRDSSAYWVKKCVRDLFSADPEGFPGDEDNGSMATWYVFSALGFYPVCPGCAEYVIAAPSVNSAVIHLENGKDFEIRADKNTPDKAYASKISLNSRKLKTSFIRHSDIINGGTLVFKMSDIPSGQKYTDNQLPYSMTK